jgi:DNA-binding PadR family transcriptional regulator
MKSTRAPSAATLILLEALASQPEADRYGYELIKSTGLPSGTLYPILMRLHDRGLLAAKWRPSPEPGRPPRHAYRLTKAGAEFAASALSKQAPFKKVISKKARA